MHMSIIVFFCNIISFGSSRNDMRAFLNREKNINKRLRSSYGPKKFEGLTDWCGQYEALDKSTFNKVQKLFVVKFNGELIHLNL
jgi:hypothetical protein